MEKAGIDTKENLLALRKSYYKLHKAFQNNENPTNFVYKLILAEAGRRLAATKQASEGAELTPALIITEVSFFKSLLLENKIFSKGFEIELPKEALISALLEHRQFFEPFDERFAGYLYQFAGIEKRTEALARIQQSNKKSSKEDIILFTQLYTPDWAADYLLANTLLPQWRAASKEVLRKIRWSKWLNEESQKSVSTAELKHAKNLKIIDPACGAGHILLRAFDFFLDLYREEGYSDCDAIAIILNSNLHGADIDEDALRVCALSLLLKAALHGQTNEKIKLQLSSAARKTKTLTSGENKIQEDDFESGSLKREPTPDSVLSRRYDAVLSNPPYIGRRLMDRRLKAFLKTAYPAAKQDLSAAFLVRALELCNESGAVGFLTQASLMYLPSYAGLRKQLLKKNLLQSVVELGPGTFPLAGGEKINSMLIVLKHKKSSSQSVFLDLKESPEKMENLETACTFSQGAKEKDNIAPAFLHRNQSDFLAENTAAFNYRYPQVLSNIISASPQLSSLVEIKQGLATGDNERFLRYFWDVEEEEIGKRWKQYIKGAGAASWYAACRNVIDWGENGEKIKAHVNEAYPYLRGKVSWVVKNEQFYFRPGLTFSFVSTGNLAVRRLPKEAIFDVGGSSLFGEENDEDILLAYLNSSFAAVCAEYINPTFNFQVGDIKQIPLLPFDDKQRRKLSEISQRAFDLKFHLERLDEAAITYVTPQEIKNLLQGAGDASITWKALESQADKSIAELANLEEQLDEIVTDCLVRAFDLDKGEKLEICKHMEKKRSQSKGHRAVITTTRDFAAYLLRQWIKEKESKSPFISTDKTLPFSNELCTELQNWLEIELQERLEIYLLNTFNKDQERKFFASPQLLCWKASETDRLAFASSASLRNLEKLPKHGRDQKNCTGYKMAEELAAELSRIKDWTGKHFAAAVKRQFETAKVALR